MAVFVSPTSSHQFALREGETLLEGLERHGYALEYQCRKGYCGTCRVRMDSLLEAINGHVIFRI